MPIDTIFPKLVPLNIYGSEQFLKSGAGKEMQEIYEGLHSARREAGCVFHFKYVVPLERILY